MTSQATIYSWSTRRDSNPHRQIRRLVLYVHPVRLGGVCAAQVSEQIQPVTSPANLYWLVD
jgi:hypothetical protein